MAGLARLVNIDDDNKLYLHGHKSLEHLDSISSLTRIYAIQTKNTNELTEFINYLLASRSVGDSCCKVRKGI